MQQDDNFASIDLPEGIHIEYAASKILPTDLDALVRYWTRSDGKFSENVREIGATLSIAGGKVVQHLAKLPATVTLRREGLLCAHCGGGPILASRTNYQGYQKRSRHTDSDGYCKSCAKWHKPMGSSTGWVLGHLTLTQAYELIRRYYAQEDCTKLVTEFSLKLAPVDFAIRMNAQIWRTSCRHCNQSLGFDIMNQIEYVEGSAERTITCSKCGHGTFIYIDRIGMPEDDNFGMTYSRFELSDVDGFQPCECKQCERERKTDPVRKRERILQTHLVPNKFVSIDELSLKQAVCLLGMIWSRTSGDHPNIILTPNLERMPLCPQDDMKWEWMRSLTRSKVIFVDVERSPLNAFDDEKVGTYYMDKVTFQSNVTLDGKSRAAPTELFSALSEKYRRGYWPDSWTEELLPLWMEIAVAECMEYVCERADHYKLDIPNTEKLREIFLKLLDDFSVSEIWYMISVAYMGAAAFMQTDQCKSRVHAVNTVPPKIVSISGQARSLCKKWSRIKSIPRSAVTEVLFDMILDADNDAGFNLSPGKTWTKVLNHHRSRSITRAKQDLEEKYMLPSDESLSDLAKDYADPRINALVKYAIAMRSIEGGV